MAAPRPLLPPVTNAVRPERSNSLFGIDSERIPQTELQNPGILRAGNLAEEAGREVRRRVAEVDAVQRVEPRNGS